jgi:hypothetical protein
VAHWGTDFLRAFSKKISALLRTLVASPLLFGLIVGGACFATVLFVFLSGDEIGWQNALGALVIFTPVAIVLSGTSAVLGSSRAWQQRLSRAFLTSCAASIPGPVLMIMRDYGFADRPTGNTDLAFVLLGLVGWAAVCIALPAFLIALAYLRYREAVCSGTDSVTKT